MQAAAQARVAGKDGIGNAAAADDFAAVQDYLIADASCMNQPGSYGHASKPAFTTAHFMLIHLCFSVVFCL